MMKIKQFFKSYINNFLACTLVGVLFYIAPPIFTQTPEGVTTISDGYISQSKETNPTLIQADSWRPTKFPYSVEKNGTKFGSSQWIKFEFNDSKITSNTVGVLIKNLPHGGLIYQNGVLVEEIPQSDEKTQNLNLSPVLIHYTKNNLHSNQTIEIQSYIGFSFAAIEPVFFGNEKSIKSMYRAYDNWNNTYVAVISSLCACVAFLLAALLLGNLKNRALRIFTALSLCWPFWLLVTTTASVPYSLWEVWRIAIGFLAVGIFYTTTEIVFIILKQKIPRFLLVFHLSLLPIIIFVTMLNDKCLWLSKSIVIIQCFGITYTIWYIFYLAIVKKSWKYFTMWLFLFWTAIASTHDILSWLGWWPKHYLLLKSIGIPEFWLQSRTVTHLVVFPTLMLISVEAVAAIRVSFEMQLKIKAAAQEERSRITMDLHDSLGATLTMGNLQSQNGNLTIENAKAVIAEAMNDLRLILNGFSEDTPNLIAIIETIAEQSKKALAFDKSVNIEYSVPYSEESPKVTPKTAINLSKIMREAVTNSAKYAKCTEITLTLKYLKDEILVTVEDNGIGFDVNQKLTENHKGNGLKNIKSRAHESGGRIHFESAPGKTILSIYMPASN